SLFPFFFNHPATTALSTLSLHDALPICPRSVHVLHVVRSSSRAAARRRGARLHGSHADPEGRHPAGLRGTGRAGLRDDRQRQDRSEEHTSELQSRENLVCRLLLEKKKTQ